MFNLDLNLPHTHIVYALIIFILAAFSLAAPSFYIKHFSLTFFTHTPAFHYPTENHEIHLSYFATEAPILTKHSHESLSTSKLTYARQI